MPSPLQRLSSGTSLVVQWLGLCVSTEGDPGSNPGQGTKIPQATQGSQKKKKKKRGQLHRMTSHFYWLLSTWFRQSLDLVWTSLVSFRNEFPLVPKSALSILWVTTEGQWLRQGLAISCGAFCGAAFQRCTCCKKHLQAMIITQMPTVLQTTERGRRTSRTGPSGNSFPTDTFSPC